MDKIKNKFYVDTGDLEMIVLDTDFYQAARQALTLARVKQLPLRFGTVIAVSERGFLGKYLMDKEMLPIFKAGRRSTARDVVDIEQSLKEYESYHTMIIPTEMVCKSLGWIRKIEY